MQPDNTPCVPHRASWPEVALAALLAVAGAAALFATAPHDGDFWWSDSPRHALNGVFVRDLVAAMPLHDPAGFAMQYYVKYPALTILFYPPLFYAISALFFAAFGVSHAVGLVAVLAHYGALALGLFLLARRWLTAPVALAVGLLVMASPGIALWGRQVMLEVPAMAFAVWAALLLLRYADRPAARMLFGALLLLLCAVYSKFSAVFLIPVFALTLVVADPRGLWRRRHVYVLAVLFVLALLPVLALTAKFGAANVQSALSIADSAAPRWSLTGWTWYARRLPEQLGWPLLIAAVVALPLLARPPRLPRADAALLILWVVVGYVFFSLIDLKEARHSTLLLPPLLVAAGLAAERIAPPRPAAGLAWALLAVTAATTWLFAPVPYVSGYRDAAAWIGQHAPQSGVVMFSGKRDGSFIFNMRANAARPDLYTVRADKLLLEVAVRRELGVAQKSLSEAEIAARLDQLGVSYAVAQTDFWVDLEAMARLQHVLQSDQFEEVARIPVLSNLPQDDQELRIYRNRHPVAAAGAALMLELPIIGQTVKGALPAAP